MRNPWLSKTADDLRTAAMSFTLALTGRDPDSFTSARALDVWRETYADPIATPAPQTCDSIACIGESPAGFSYAIVEDPAGFADECGRADLIVARVVAPTWCGGGTVIDPPELLAHGAHWLRWDAGRKAFEVRPAIAALDRPWRIAP